MTAFHLLVASSAVGWFLLIGLAVSVVRIEKLVIGMQTEQQDGPTVGTEPPAMVIDGADRLWGGSADTGFGLPRLVWFMRADCRPCQHTRALVGALASQYQGRVSCWVNYVGTSEAAGEFAQDWGSLVRLVVDPSRTNQTRWKIRRVPGVVLVGGDGAVTWKGIASRKSIEEALNALDAGESAQSRPKSGIGA